MIILGVEKTNNVLRVVRMHAILIHVSIVMDQQLNVNWIALQLAQPASVNHISIVLMNRVHVCHYHVRAVLLRLFQKQPKSLAQRRVQR